MKKTKLPVIYETRYKHKLNMLEPGGGYAQMDRNFPSDWFYSISASAEICIIYCVLLCRSNIFSSSDSACY